MKTLVLMRHGEAGEADTDHARPLTTAGRQQCLRVSRELREAGVAPDRVLCSDAERARTSAELVLEGLALATALQSDRALYLAEPLDYLTALQSARPTVDTQLLVAHNPGLSTLASILEGRAIALPTAGYAVMRLELSDWTALGQ